MGIGDNRLSDVIVGRPNEVLHQILCVGFAEVGCESRGDGRKTALVEILDDVIAQALRTMCQSQVLIFGGLSSAGCWGFLSWRAGSAFLGAFFVLLNRSGFLHVR